jgi:precorrin-6B methylase 1
MPSQKESAVRARARRLGYAIHKSRSRSIHEDNLGKYALVKDDGNFVVLGERFDASLEEIAEYLS